MGVIVFCTGPGNAENKIPDDITITADNAPVIPDYKGEVTEAFEKDGKRFVRMRWVKCERNPPVTDPPPPSEVEYTDDWERFTSMLVKCSYEGCEMLVSPFRRKCQSHS